jgi:hypothetical protein
MNRVVSYIVGSQKEQQDAGVVVPSDEHDDLFRERAKYIPLRLSLGERKYLRLLEAALAASEYTSKVDHTQFRNKNRRTHAQLQDICAVMSGLVVACNYKVGQEVIESRNYKEHERFFRDIFEHGRRHKIMNPGTRVEEYNQQLHVLHID